MHPELVDSRLVELGVEVGCTWSPEKQIVFDPTHLCKGTLRKPPRATTGGASVAPWESVLSCSAARAVAMSLLELPDVRKRNVNLICLICFSSFVRSSYPSKLVVTYHFSSSADSDQFLTNHLLD